MNIVKCPLLSALFCLCFSCQLQAQSVNPSATYTTSAGKEVEESSPTEEQDAPLTGHFFANPTDLGSYTARYEWKIWKDGDKDNLLAHRFEENFDYIFSESGKYYIQLYATLTEGGDTISLPDEDDENPFIVSIKTSKLEMPNAFSPNGDGKNDVYNAKTGYQSIIEFKATIFNRWGQRIFSWSNPDREQDGWDGTWHGHRVRDGVYYVVVNAKGADGTVYNIRKDVNMLTNYDNGAEESNSGTEN